MTPIFKRYFKKGAFLALGCLIFILSVSFVRMNDGSRWIDLVQNEITAKDITAETFRTKEGRERVRKMSEQMLETDYYKQSLSNAAFTTNEKNVLVPLIRPAVSAALEESEACAGVMGCVFAIAFACMAFMSERRRNTIGFVGTLPYKRAVMFADKWLAGSLCIAVLFIAEYIVLSLWVMKITPQCGLIAERLLYGDDTVPVMIPEYGGTLMVGACLTAAFYSLLMFAQTLFGKPNYAVALASGAVLMGLIGIRGMAEFYFDYDLSFSRGFFMKIIHLLQDIAERTWLTCLIFAVLAAVFLLAGLLCDRAARLERAGGVFMFSFVKVLVYAFFMLTGAFSFYLFATEYCEFPIGNLSDGLLLLAVGAGAVGLGISKLMKEV